MQGCAVALPSSDNSTIPYSSKRRASTLNEADQNCNHSQDEQNVNESTQCVRADHAQHPEDQQQNSYSPEHWHSFLESVSPAELEV
jgi:hypothetical protein